MRKCQELLEASRCGNISAICKILQHKTGPFSSFRRSPSINWQDVNGYTALHHACLNGHYEIVKVLLTHHAAHDIADVRGSTPLYLAAWAGNEHIVNLILMLRGISNLDAQTIENETALHCAAQHGHNSVVSALLARGADPTIRNNSFQTPLDLAAQFGRLDVVQTLICKHPELIEPYRLYDEVLDVDNGCSLPYKITPTKHIFTQSCIHLAARNGHNEVVKTLLAAGVNVNILTHAGSALHEAALCGKKNVVCILLDAGIDLYAVDGNSRTALDILKEYPTNVTYEILTIINDFWQNKCSLTNESHFKPIKDVNDNHTNNSSNSSRQDIEIETPEYEQQLERSLKINTVSLRSGSADSNNNNRKCSESRHSPTPDCPPPSASEAESTIFEFVKPSEKSLKRKSLLLQQQDSQFYNGLKSFIWEDETQPQDEQLDSLSSSRVSECVEEFIGDVPFAGLFKGSSLNLANASTSDLRNSLAIDEIPSGLRSPSLVRSVKTIAAKSNVASDVSTSDDEYGFDASKAWDEINTIFESIGNEVAIEDTTKLEEINEQNALTNNLHKKTFTIRKPAELLLGSATQQERNSNPNWCHSANTLIYGYVVYNVFYLGSTVIRELHGTASTRKSIQKLKREETPSPQEDNEENGLIKDINCSTRILKETNQQTRLEVGIAMSHAGVRFVEIENKSTICVHDIENINCVSQDTEDLRYFAYITRENCIHYCHVFMVDDLNLATEIILTLGQAFEVAYQLSLIGQESSLQTSQPKNV